MSGTLEQALIGKYGEDSLPVLHRIKEEAKSDFLKKGLPKFKEEEYKFTPITKVLEKNFTFTEKGGNGNISSDDLKALVIDANAPTQLFFINGKFSDELSVINETDGIVVKNMEAAIKENKDQVVKHFGKLGDDDSFTSLNTALTQDGTFIEVAKNKVIDQPVYLYFVNDALDVEANSFPRNLILSNTGSQACVVEKTITIGKHNAFINSLTEVFVSENARLDHVRIQNDPDNAFEVTQSKVYQEDNSTYSAFTATLSGGMVRNNINIISDGQNCESNMYGLYLLDNKTHVDNHTTVDHKQPNSYSNELYKGVMDGRSKGVFNGKIYVRQEAQKTNAFQSNNNILLSDNATLNTKPQLEIWADDVKCSHGCTSGQLDEEAIFYLRARGISHEKAIGMLLYAFANDVVEKLPVAEIRS
ncbi:MAG: Fe-S cluster assembly protein SufD, partial [Cyclobacteriaceae bacterium]